VRFKIDPDKTFWRILDGEAVIISAETSHYYSLNRSGTFIWTLLAEGPLSEEEIVARVAAHFERSPREVSADVARLLADLRDEHLLAVE